VRNSFIDNGSARDIDQRISRVLKDLGYSSGPVNLSEVRQLLRLDIGYYTADDASLAGEIVHKLRIGAKQVMERPSLLLEAIRKLDLRALFLPDRKRILIDANLPDLKKRWSETHEIAHSLIPWHVEYMLGDTRETLAPSCHEVIEAEANYGAGRLLFPASQFLDMAREGKTLSHVKRLAEEYGNTITTTLWRYVENSDDVLFGAIGEHPKRPRTGEPPIAYFIRSRTFEQRFSRCDETEIFKQIGRYCGYQRTGPLGYGELVLTDNNGDNHIFTAETFGNRYNALTLARYASRQNVTLSADPSVY
jgi:hypothetical protein